jgi:hypothetical protein
MTAWAAFAATRPAASATTIFEYDIATSFSVEGRSAGGRCGMDGTLGSGGVRPIAVAKQFGIGV